MSTKVGQLLASRCTATSLRTGAPDCTSLAVDPVTTVSAVIVRRENSLQMLLRRRGSAGGFLSGGPSRLVQPTHVGPVLPRHSSQQVDAFTAVNLSIILCFSVCGSWCCLGAPFCSGQSNASTRAAASDHVRDLDFPGGDTTRFASMLAA